MNSVFRFKQFSIKQDPKVFKVGTDGVLLGCLADVSKAQSVLDIGTGTGLLSLMIAQRNPSTHITAIDSEEDAYNLTKENVDNSPFSSSISVIHSNLHCFNPEQKFDYIICNPPYFKNSEQLHHKHPVARHQLKLDYPGLLKKSEDLLSPQGTVGYIFPFEEEELIIAQAEALTLFPKRIIRIFGIKNGKIRRTFLELSWEKQETKTEEFYIEESPRIWSDLYKNLTNEFYL